MIFVTAGRLRATIWPQLRKALQEFFRKFAVSSNGAILVNYEPAGPITTGTAELVH
jgi:hypothetical protein